MGHSSAGLHHFDDGGFDHVLSVVFDLVLEVIILGILLSLAVHHGNFDLVHVVLITEVHSERIFHFEIFAHWGFVQDFELAQRDEVGLQVCLGDLHRLDEVMVRHFLLLVEKHQDAHLVSGDGHLVLFGALVAYFGSDFGIALVEFPVELAAREFGHVVLLEDTHALLDLRRDLNEINLLEALILGRGVSAFVRPVASCEDFYVQIDGDLLAAGALSEVLHPLLRHFDILEHDLKPLSKLEPTLFLELLDHLFLSVLQNSA